MLHQRIGLPVGMMPVFGKVVTEVEALTLLGAENVANLVITVGLEKSIPYSVVEISKKIGIKLFTKEKYFQLEKLLPRWKHSLCWVQRMFSLLAQVEWKW
jgi:hypothetical protein